MSVILGTGTVAEHRSARPESVCVSEQELTTAAKMQHLQRKLEESEAARRALQEYVQELSAGYNKLATKHNKLVAEYEHLATQSRIFESGCAEMGREVNAQSQKIKELEESYWFGSSQRW